MHVNVPKLNKVFLNFDQRLYAIKPKVGVNILPEHDLTCSNVSVLCTLTFEYLKTQVPVDG
jgi:hypothetical protein